ncbi:hypothetical protein CDAR_460271 [Caerostris darwini]|uniref:Uncharacterized protein n=1 Tax=Caerostris darwini TaxID=1538125 RepID=A0AAV4RBQ9_9ARAC|nr:hypothetical protein CDAR_460271 [Caerostris darwini]
MQHSAIVPNLTRLPGLGQSVNEKNNPSIKSKSTDQCPVSAGGPVIVVTRLTLLRGPKQMACRRNVIMQFLGLLLSKMNEWLFSGDGFLH